MKEKIAKNCVNCKKKFLIIPQELDFYTRKSLPLPKACSPCRRNRRTSLRNERKLYDRKCDKCDISLKSTYPLDSEYIIYCEKCYLNSIN